MFRYVSNHEVCERFVEFIDCSLERSAEQVAALAISVIERYKVCSKLVAQTYDGASVMSGEVSGVNIRVKEKYHEALFIHCYAHKLNLVLSQSVRRISSCKRFFSVLSGLSGFFSRSTKRSSAFNLHVKRRIPTVSETRWNSNTRLVGTVHSIQWHLVSFFEGIIESPQQWDDGTVDAAGGYIAKLQSTEFLFLIEVFQTIFPHTEMLFSILQTKRFDISYCNSKVQDVKETMQQLRNDESFDHIWQQAFVTNDESELPRKKRKVDDTADKIAYRRLFFEIVDHILQEISARFKSLRELCFVELLNPEKFVLHSKEFPRAAFTSLINVYGCHFNHVKLETELRALYCSKEFYNLFPYQVLQMLFAMRLFKTMPQVTKLCELILTIPATTASVERSFSALTRIKSVYRNTMGQDRLASLSLFSIERSLLTSLRSKTSFHDEVIDLFAAMKDRRIELTYK